MARVRMLKMAAGPDGRHEIGKVYDLDDDRARAFVEAGAAVLLPDRPAAPVSTDPPKVERQIVTPPENATGLPQRKPRRKG